MGRSGNTNPGTTPTYYGIQWFEDAFAQDRSKLCGTDEKTEGHIIFSKISSSKSIRSSMLNFLVGLLSTPVPHFN